MVVGQREACIGAAAVEFDMHGVRAVADGKHAIVEKLGRGAKGYPSEIQRPDVQIEIEDGSAVSVTKREGERRRAEEEDVLCRDIAQRQRSAGFKIVVSCERIPAGDLEIA